MTEIKVVEIPSDKPLTSGERSELFGRWAHELKVPIKIFNELGSLIDEIDIMKTMVSSPEILMLKIRHICHFTSVTPVSLVRKKRMQTIADIRTEYSIPESTFGVKGSAPPKTKKDKKPKKDTPDTDDSKDKSTYYKTTTTFMKSQRFVHLDDLDKYTGSPGAIPRKLDTPTLRDISTYIEFDSTIDICGFIVDPSTPVLEFNAEIYPFIEMSDAIRRIGSPEYLMNMLLLKNVNNIWDDDMKGHNVFDKIGKHKIILFKDIEHATAVCDLILNTLVSLVKSIHASISAWYVERNISESINKPEYAWSSIWVEPIPKIVKDVKISEKLLYPILSKLNGLYPVRFNQYSESALWFDLLNSGLLDDWKQIQNKSPKDQEIYIRNLIKERKEFLSAQDDLHASQVTAFNRFYLEMQHRYYYIQKFGIDKFNDVMSKIPIGARDGAELLKFTTPKEANLVLIDYKKNEKFLEAQSHSKESWIRVVQLMRHEESLRTRQKLYKELKKLVRIPPGPHTSDLKKDPGLKNNDWIRSSKGYPIICPHIRDMFELEMHAAPDTSIKEYLIRNYAGEIPVYQAYYCRICGERLSSTKQMEGVTTEMRIEGYSGIEDELRSYVWSTVSQIVRLGVEFRELQTSQDIKKFISTITNNLYVFADLIEKMLNKQKTVINEEKENRKRLMVIIYVYAMLVKIVSDNPHQVRFNTPKFKGFKKVDIKKLLDHVIDVIVLSQNTVINNISEFGKTVTTEYIKKILDSAFKHISDVVGKSKIREPVQPKLIQNILLDPLYLFIADGNLLVTMIRNTKLSEFKKVELETILPKQVLRSSLVEIEETQRGIYERATNPYKSWITGWKPDTLKNAVNIKSGNIDHDLMTLYVSHQAMIGDYLLEYTHSGVFENPVWETTITQDPNSGIDIITATLGPAYTTFIAKYQKMMDLEIIKNNIYNHFRAHVVGSLWRQIRSYRYAGFNTETDFKYLSLVYGIHTHKGNADMLSIKTVNKFHKHKFSVYVWCTADKYADKPLSKYKPKDIILYSGDGKIPIESDIILIDKYCSICGAGFKEAQKGSSDVQNLLEHHRDIVNFYNYFSYNCPSPKPKDLRDGNPYHVFGKSGCLNCGFKKEFIDDLDPGYYNKWKKSSIGAKQKTNVKSIPLTLRAKKKSVSKITWAYQTGIINEFSIKTHDIIRKGSLLGDSPYKPRKFTKNEYFNIITYIGLIQGVEFDKIRNGVEKPKESGLKRRNILHPYIQNIIKDIGSIINHKNVSLLNPSYKLILDSSSADDLTKLSKIKMVDLYAKVNKKMKVPADMSNLRYYELSQKILIGLSDIDVSKFTLTYLLRLILEFIGILGTQKITSKVIDEIMLLLISRFLNIEESLSKMPPQKKANVEIVQGPHHDNANMVDNRQSRDFDDIVDPDATDKYSYADLDYDGVNDDY